MARAAASGELRGLLHTWGHNIMLIVLGTVSDVHTAWLGVQTTQVGTTAAVAVAAGLGGVTSNRNTDSLCMHAASIC